MKAEDPIKAADAVIREIEDEVTVSPNKAKQIARRFNAYSPGEKDRYLRLLADNLKQHIGIYIPLSRSHHEGDTTAIGRTNRQADNLIAVQKAVEAELGERIPAPEEATLQRFHHVVIAYYEGRLKYEPGQKGQVCKGLADELGFSMNTIQRDLGKIERFPGQYKTHIKAVLSELTQKAKERAEADLEARK